MPEIKLSMELIHQSRLARAEAQRRQKQMNDLYERTTALGLTSRDVEDIANCCHTAVMAWARAHGDYSHEIWTNASAEHKHSMRSGVIAQLEDPDRTPETNHAAWLEQKLADGWTWGPVRREDIKQNPAIVTYSELPALFRQRNAIFQAIVNALDPRKY